MCTAEHLEHDALLSAVRGSIPGAHENLTAVDHEPRSVAGGAATHEHTVRIYREAVESGPAWRRLRASDADRERAVGQLSKGLRDGQLTTREFDERVRAVYSARTRGEIDDLVVDLPPDLW